MTKTMMIKGALSAMLATVLVCGTTTFAQALPTPVTTTQPVQSQSQAAKAAEKPLVPLKVQVTLSRYEGEKKTSSLPFTLWVNANDPQKTSLNVGIQVPVPTGSANGDFQYRNVGTNLTCLATVLDDGRFRIDLAINDSSISASKDSKATFQSLTTQNFLLLRDGQNAQFVAATDKVTGEVTKVDVTVTVLK